MCITRLRGDRIRFTSIGATSSPRRPILPEWPLELPGQQQFRLQTRSVDGVNRECRRRVGGLPQSYQWVWNSLQGAQRCEISGLEKEKFVVSKIERLISPKSAVRPRKYTRRRQQATRSLRKKDMHFCSRQLHSDRNKSREPPRIQQRNRYFVGHSQGRRQRIHRESDYLHRLSLE